MSHRWSSALFGGVCLLAAVSAHAQQSPPAEPPSQVPVALLPEIPQLEPKAIDILKAMSARLAAAHTMTFTALTTYESPARTGQPLAYTTLSEVALERPDKLRVITPGDGPRSEFYYDGKTMTAYSPESGHVAIAAAPPTIDAMLAAAYKDAAIYYSFSDVIVADPYKDIADGLKLAFVVGQSRVALPRMARATYFNEPGGFRHVVELSDWHLDPAIPAGSFASAEAAKAIHIDFASPDEKLPDGN